jgi:hypothetical protein
MAYDNRSNDHITGRGSKRRNEIQIIKQLPLVHLLEKQGFTATQRKLSSAVFHDLPNIDGAVTVFLATRQKDPVWLCKYKNPDSDKGKDITRTVIDLWGVIYHSDKSIKDRYPHVMRELRVIAGISTEAQEDSTREDPAGMPDEPAGNKTVPADQGRGEGPAGSFFDGGKMDRMKERYAVLMDRLKDADTDSIPEAEMKKAKAGVTVMDRAMLAGNEVLFNACARTIERLMRVAR